MTITHAQALKKLAAAQLVSTLDNDIARLTAHGWLLAKHNSAIAADISSYVIPPLLRRWNSVLNTDQSSVPIEYRHKVIVALVILLHKYGMTNTALVKQAEIAIDALNSTVVLSDDFFRRTEAFKQTFLQTPPASLKRRPAVRNEITVYRSRDVIAVELEHQFHVAYVHDIAGAGTSPVIEFYDAVFNHIPQLTALDNIPARGAVYDDGVQRVERFAVAGMNYQLDPAGQIILLASNVATPPSSSHLTTGVGLYTVTDIFDLQHSIQQLFMTANRT